jgi:hypothetical protein
MYRGSLKVGSTVEAVFKAERSNSGTASMVVTYGPDEGSPTVRTTLAAPGGVAPASAEVPVPGFLRVWVDVSDEADSGRLSVEDGSIVDADDIQGDTTWLYSVQ